MTIKQNGGIFGRNPTFNNIEADGTITASDDIIANSKVRIEAASNIKLEMLDTDGGFDASYLLVENGGRDLSIFAPQDIIFDQDGAETARFRDGGGLCFNGDTAADNALDDYEEGTFTPVVADAASGGNVDPTTQRGVYTKIGRLVNITIELEDVDTATNSMSGTLFIRDLPFTPASLTGKIRYVSPVLFGSGVTFDTSYFYTAQIQDGLNYATIKEVRSGTTANNLQASALTSGSNDINMQFSYYV